MAGELWEKMKDEKTYKVDDLNHCLDCDHVKFRNNKKGLLILKCGRKTVSEYGYCKNIKTSDK
jgi:hypothetical protein